MNKTGLYVIRSKSGMKFFSCELGKVGEEETYYSRVSADIAFNQLQETFPSEEFEILEQEEVR